MRVSRDGGKVREGRLTFWKELGGVSRCKYTSDKAAIMVGKYLALIKQSRLVGEGIVK